ncbi:zinc ribbon domain-containing protein [Streptomyces mirabilis]|uniref:zinc ribbon domain-containing protein n=1 Tax=Streptomyces mirabilis TaxID=68239 RepID=UPI0036373E2D
MANRVSQAWFACRNCGFVDHADRNSSRNIRARARELWRRGAPSTAPAPPRKHPDGAGRKRGITPSDVRWASPSLQRRAVDSVHAGSSPREQSSGGAAEELQGIGACRSPVGQGRRRDRPGVCRVTVRNRISPGGSTRAEPSSMRHASRVDHANRRRTRIDLARSGRA